MKLAAVLAVFLVAFSFLPAPSRSRAQTAGNEPRIIITWKSKTYAPPFFTGKALPTANSMIEASVEVLDGGKFADISRETIYWYVNGNFVSGGSQNTSYRAPETSNTAVDLRAQLPNYKGNLILKTITIPIVAPEAVIGAPYPRRRVSSSPFRLYAYPFFFNVGFASNLGISWVVNGKTVFDNETPDVLSVAIPEDLPSDAQIPVKLIARNPASFYEAAGQDASFVVKR
jgi:hypothetical protein